MRLLIFPQKDRRKGERRRKSERDRESTERRGNIKVKQE
jgi:hypothetical protein